MYVAGRMDTLEGGHVLLAKLAIGGLKLAVGGLSRDSPTPAYIAYTLYNAQHNKKNKKEEK